MDNNQLATRQQADFALVLPTEERERFQQLCTRLRTLVSGGRKLSDEQVTGLAQFAAAEKLDPFSGECYMMTDSSGKTMGPVVGVKGLLRKAQEQLGRGENIMTNYVIVPPPAGGAKVRIAYACELRDTVSIRNWTQLYKDLASAGMKHDEIKLSIGPAPVYIGYGFFYETEASEYKDLKFSPSEKAQKRALAAALRKRFSLPYNFGDNGEGGNVVSERSIGDDVVDVIPQQPEPPSAPRGEKAIMAELGFEPEPEPEPEPEEAPSDADFDEPEQPNALYDEDDIERANKFVTPAGRQLCTMTPEELQSIVDYRYSPAAREKAKVMIANAKILLGLPQ